MNMEREAVLMLTSLEWKHVECESCGAEWLVRSGEGRLFSAPDLSGCCEKGETVDIQESRSDMDDYDHAFSRYCDARAKAEVVFTVGREE